MRLINIDEVVNILFVGFGVEYMMQHPTENFHDVWYYCKKAYLT